MALKIKTLTGLVNAALHIKTAGGIVPVNLHTKTAGGIELLSGGASIRGLLKLMGSTNVSSAFADKTMALSAALPVKAKRVRAHVYGLGAANGIRLSIASSNSAANKSVPSGGVGSFAQFVFSSNSHAASSVGSSASAVPVEDVSDWLDITALDRTDGGNGYLYYLRYFEDATSAGNRCSMATTAPTAIDTYGWWAGISGVGDFTGATSTFTDSTSGPPVWLEFETDQPCKTVAWIGDSTDEGRDAYSLRTHSGARLAVDALNAAGKRTAYFNAGWNGASTAGASGTPPATVSGYWAQFLSFMASCDKKPDVVCFKPTSPNNSYFAWSQAQAEYWCDVFIAWAMANGVTPVLVTPTPVNRFSEATETLRRACVTAIKAKATAAGIQCVDRDAIFTNYAVPTGGWEVAGDTSDGTHLTSQGAEKERDEAWHPVLNALI